MAKKNKASDVFNQIDTKGNDPDVCWPWTGYAGGRDGRGYFSLDGRRRLAYHVVFELFNEPLREFEVVRHKCDNPLCCNPTHLERGSKSDNENDKYERDRAGYTNDMILEMRRLDKFNMSYRKIAEHVSKKFECEVSFSGVRKVLRGETRSAKKSDAQLIKEK